MSEWKQHIFLAIPNKAENAFLFLPTDEGKWRLPLYDVEIHLFNMHLQQRRFRQDLKANMTVLNWFGKRREESPEIKHFWVIALMENHEPDWTIPAGAAWFDAQALETLPMLDEWQREALLTSLKGLKEEAPALRPPWFRQGWFQRARQWTERELENRGYRTTGEVEQFKHWSLSVLLRVETVEGLVFFKLSNKFPLFANEPMIMEKLAEFFPKFVPRPLAINADERWMLMADFGAEKRDETEHKPVLMQMARDYARFQQATRSPEMIARLETAGCFNRRIAVLEAQIEGMYADEASYAGLNEEERSAWKACRPQLISLCQQLSAYKIPDTLVHGDFHSGNVALRENDFLVFDWTDACISHPFFDLPIFLDYDGGDDADEIRQAYLSEWLDYEPKENLEAIYKLAVSAAMLHQVISYQGIRNGVEAEQQGDWERAVVYFIRKIVKAVPELGL
jgi:aminoglycoside phosphotransferase (APT) family kinase protein